MRRELLVFDKNGKLVRHRSIAKYLQLIDNKQSTYLIEKISVSKFDAPGVAQWSHEFYPWQEQSNMDKIIAVGYATDVSSVPFLLGKNNLFNRY